MKKIITTLGIAIIGLGLSSNIAFAQEAPATLTLQQQYQATLVTLIGLLQQQVQSLLTQLQTMQTKIDTSAMTTDQKVDLIVGQVNDIASKLQPAPPPQIPVNKDLIVKIIKEKVENYQAGAISERSYSITVFYTEDGKAKEGVAITLTSEDGDFTNLSGTPTEGFIEKGEGRETVSNYRPLTTTLISKDMGIGGIGIVAMIHNAGKTLTISANGVVKTVDL